MILREWIRGQTALALLWEPRDLWVGVYVHGGYWEGGQYRRRLYVCLLPALPVRLDWRVR
jgi:hypothetical protein